VFVSVLYVFVRFGTFANATVCFQTLLYIGNVFVRL
jgi:hypothetical protein